MSHSSPAVGTTSASESLGVSGTRVVLLHGVGLDRHMWALTQRELAGHGIAATALDLPGHGQAGPVPDGVTLAELAETIASQLTPATHLVGFSLGALVAQHLAVYRPELVATLTCVSSVCQRTDSEREAVMARLRLAEADFPASVEASLTRWYQGTDVAPEEVAATRATLLGNDRRSYLACYRVFATGDAELAPVLGSIDAPTLAITGEEDPGSTPQMSQRLTAAVPDARLEVLSHTRHMLPVQRPGELAVAVSTITQENDHDRTA